MKFLHLGFAVLAVLPGMASAESLRCDKGIVSEGDSRLSVIYKCGQPQLIDTFCDPVYYGGTLQMVPAPIGDAYVPCLTVQEWLYERQETYKARRDLVVAGLRAAGGPDVGAPPGRTGRPSSGTSGCRASSAGWTTWRTMPARQAAAPASRLRRSTASPTSSGTRCCR